MAKIKRTFKPKSAVQATQNKAQRRRKLTASEELPTQSIKAEEEFEEEFDDGGDFEDEVIDEVGAVDIDPDAFELLFETADVAELLAEATGAEVVVEENDGVVNFEIGDEIFTITPDGDEEEVMEAISALSRNKVTASRKAQKPRSRVMRRK